MSVTIKRYNCFTLLSAFVHTVILRVNRPVMTRHLLKKYSYSTAFLKTEIAAFIHLTRLAVIVNIHFVIDGIKLGWCEKHFA